MKKLVMMLVCMFAVHTMVMADNDKPIEVSQLPAKAQTFIKTYFKDHKVAMAKLESGMFYKSYDVVFTNGEKVEFDKSGEWKEVRCRQSEVPVLIYKEMALLGASCRKATQAMTLSGFWQTSPWYR